MKRFLSLLLVSTLAFAFTSKAQTVKKFDAVGQPAEVNITANPLSSGTITTITTATNYSVSTTALSALPSTDTNCPGVDINCSFYVLIPALCAIPTDQDILNGVKTYINNNSNQYPTPGSAFSFTVVGSSCTFQGVFFAHN